MENVDGSGETRAAVDAEQKKRKELDCRVTARAMETTPALAESIACGSAWRGSTTKMTEASCLQTPTSNGGRSVLCRSAASRNVRCDRCSNACQTNSRRWSDRLRNGRRRRNARLPLRLHVARAHTPRNRSGRTSSKPCAGAGNERRFEWPWTYHPGSVITFYS